MPILFLWAWGVFGLLPALAQNLEKFQTLGISAPTDIHEPKPAQAFTGSRGVRHAAAPTGPGLGVGIGSCPLSCCPQPQHTLPFSSRANEHVADATRIPCSVQENVRSNSWESKSDTDTDTFNSVQTRCIVKARLRKVYFSGDVLGFLIFSGSPAL